MDALGALNGAVADEDELLEAGVELMEDEVATAILDELAEVAEVETGEGDALHDEGEMAEKNSLASGAVQ